MTSSDRKREEAAQRVAVLGGGAWGGTLAWLLTEGGVESVRLYRRPGAAFDKLLSSRELLDPLPVRLSESCSITSDLGEALDGAEIVILACTSSSMVEVVKQVSLVMSDSLRSRSTFVSVVKGLDPGSLKRMSEVAVEMLGTGRVLALSGPNLAFEIRSGLPCAAVVAHRDLSLAQYVQHSLSTPGFRLYASEDIAGVELGGTLKNVIAIAAGASDGLKLGVNAKSALLTRGLAEMVRLSANLGARPNTLFGLSGMGDLIATCQGPLSRNYRIGMYLAENASLEEALEKVGSVAEGVQTTNSVCELSKKLDIDLPIALQVQATLKGSTTPKDSIMALMSRPLAKE